MRFFRTSALEPLAVSMSGVKLGDRLLVMGASDPRLVAALAGRAGLTGRACVIDASQAAVDALSAAVLREGALVESFTSEAQLPFDAGAFDVCVIRGVLAALPQPARRVAASEAFRVLRPGGRCVVIEDAPAGLAAVFRRPKTDPAYVAEGGAEGALQVAGFRGVRTLAERAGQRFVEGTRGA